MLFRIQLLCAPACRSHASHKRSARPVYADRSHNPKSLPTILLAMYYIRAVVGLISARSICADTVSQQLVRARPVLWRSTSDTRQKDTCRPELRIAYKLGPFEGVFPYLSPSFLTSPAQYHPASRCSTNTPFSALLQLNVPPSQ